MKNSGSFHISAQNQDCGYLLEPTRRGVSNEYPQSMLWAEIRQLMRWLNERNLITREQIQNDLHISINPLNKNHGTVFFAQISKFRSFVYKVNTTGLEL